MATEMQLHQLALRILETFQHVGFLEGESWSVFAQEELA